MTPDPAQPRPFDDPLQPVPRQPMPAGDFPPPDFEDEYEMNRRRARPGPSGRNGPPFNIGHDDLYPQGLGPNDPFRSSLTDPSRRAPGSGGMHPTFDDPLFRRDPSRGYDPRAPPGARYDPVGPGDMELPGSDGRFIPGRTPGPNGWRGLGGDLDPFSSQLGSDMMMPRSPGRRGGPPFGGGPPGGGFGGNGFGGNGYGGGFGGGFGGGIL